MPKPILTDAGTGNASIVNPAPIKSMSTALDSANSTKTTSSQSPAPDIVKPSQQNKNSSSGPVMETDSGTKSEPLPKSLPLPVKPSQQTSSSNGPIMYTDSGTGNSSYYIDNAFKELYETGLDTDEYESYVKGVEKYYDEQLDIYKNLQNELETKIANLKVIEDKMDILVNREKNIMLGLTDDPNVEVDYNAIASKSVSISVQLKSHGYNSYEELISDLNAYRQILNETKIAINATENQKDSAKYDYLPLSNNFRNFDDITYTEEEKKAALTSFYYEGSDTDGGIGDIVFSWDDFHSKNPNGTPADFVQSLSDNVLGYYKVEGLDNSKEIENLIRASEIAPELLKKYQYLYEMDPSLANDFLNKCEYQINQINGAASAKQFLDNLWEQSESNDLASFSQGLMNEFQVAGRGLLDGLGTFGDGIGYFEEAINTLMGTAEENRVLSEDEYKKMAILSALYSRDAKIESGILFLDENGNYVNSDQNSLIDYTKDYAGVFLSNNYEISQGIGNMLPSIVLSSINPALGLTALGVSAGGNAYHESMVNGSTLGEAVAYGVYTGTSEALTEWFLGGVVGISDTAVTDLSSFLNSLVKEANEEMFQEVMNAAVKTGYNSIKNGVLPNISNNEFNEFMEDVLKAGAYGAITAGVLNSGGIAGSSILNNLITTNQQPNVIQNTTSNIGLREREKLLSSINDSVAQINDGLKSSDEIIETYRNGKMDKYAKYYDLKSTLDIKDNYDLIKQYLDLPTTKETQKVLSEILLDGGYEGFGFDSDLCSNNNRDIELVRRISMAAMYLTNPETFMSLADNGINMFHGTNSSVLSNILKNGLNSVEQIEKKGESVSTGEYGRMGLGNQKTIRARDFISFTDIFDIAYGYADSPNDGSFGVVIGTTSDIINNSRKYYVHSDITEVGVADVLPTEKIKTLIVPGDKVELVKRMVGNRDIKVLSIDGYDKRPFYYDVGSIENNVDRFNDFSAYVKIMEHVDLLVNSNSSFSTETKIKPNQTESNFPDIIVKWNNDNGKKSIYLLAPADISQNQFNSLVNLNNMIKNSSYNGDVQFEIEGYEFDFKDYSSDLQNLIDIYKLKNDLKDILSNKYTNIDYQVKKQLSDVYIEGMINASSKYYAFFQNFRDHSLRHIIEVTDYALTRANELAGKGIDVSVDEILLSALCHDLGMKGGIYYTTNEDGTRQWHNVDELFEGKLTYESSLSAALKARKMHNLQSAFDLLLLKNELFSSDMDVDSIALIVAAHGKSTSGLRHMSSTMQLLNLVDLIDSGVKYYQSIGEEISFDAKALKERILNDNDFKNRLIIEAMIVRDADAMSEVPLSGQNSQYMQTGKVATVKKSNPRDRNDYNRPIMKSDNNDGVPVYEKELLDEGITDTLSNGNEVSDKFSIKIHTGELNAIFDSIYDKNHYSLNVKMQNANDSPNATWDAIQERIEEVVTYDNFEQREVIINLPIECASGTELSEFYTKKIEDFKKETINKLKKEIGKVDDQVSELDLPTELLTKIKEEHIDLINKTIDFIENGIKINYISDYYGGN